MLRSFRSSSCLTVLALCALLETAVESTPAADTSGAVAQNDAPPPPPGVGAAPPPAPAPEPATPSSPVMAQPMGPSGAAPSAAMTAPPPPDATPPPPPAGPKWYDTIAFDAFVDAYGQINYSLPKPQAPTPYPTNFGDASAGGNQFRAFDSTNGFALHWVGVNASIAPDPVGGTISLRLGPAAQLYTSSGQDARYGLQYVKQAYASWKPGGKDSAFQIDFGKFDEPYGSEVAETQLNMNYSRSALFLYAQPFFFTGLRLDFQPTPVFDVKLLAANGWNNSVSQNSGKSVGIQFNIKPSDTSLISAGYVVGPQQTDFNPGALPSATNANVPGASTNLRHLVDFIADFTLGGSFRMLLNADYGHEEVNQGSIATDLTRGSYDWYGVNLGLRYAFSDPFGIAVRGEYYRDPQGVTLGTLAKNTQMVDATLTLDWKPTNNLVLRLEGRLDSVTSDAHADYFLTTNGTAKVQGTTLLGIVAKTN